MSTISKLVSYFEAIQEYLKNQDREDNASVKTPDTNKEASDPVTLLRAPHNRTFRTPSFTSFPKALISSRHADAGKVKIEALNAPAADDLDSKEVEVENHCAIASEADSKHGEVYSRESPPKHSGIQSLKIFDTLILCAYCISSNHCLTLCRMTLNMMRPEEYSYNFVL